MRVDSYLQNYVQLKSKLATFGGHSLLVYHLHIIKDRYFHSKVPIDTLSTTN